MFQKESLDELVVCLVAIVAAVGLVSFSPNNDKVIAFATGLSMGAFAVYKGASTNNKRD